MSTFRIDSCVEMPVVKRVRRVKIGNEVHREEPDISEEELALRNAVKAKMKVGADRLASRVFEDKPKVVRKPNKFKPAKQKLTMERVRELFDYIPETGQLIRKISVGHRPSTKAGVIVGYPDSSGYLQVMVDWWQRSVHLVIWVWHHGYEPEHVLDHRDRDVSNNRIENLREVTSQCNTRNTGNSSRCATGIKGVRWSKADGAWFVYIGINGPKTIKRTPDFTEAVCHRYAAEQCLNFNDCDANSPAYQYLKKEGILK